MKMIASATILLLLVLATGAAAEIATATRITSQGIDPMVPVGFSDSPVIWNDILIQTKDRSLVGGVGISVSLPRKAEGTVNSLLSFFGMSQENSGSLYAFIKGRKSVGSTDIDGGLKILDRDGMSGTDEIAVYGRITFPAVQGWTIRTKLAFFTVPKILDFKAINYREAEVIRKISLTGNIDTDFSASVIRSSQSDSIIRIRTTAIAPMFGSIRPEIEILQNLGKETRVSIGGWVNF